MWSYEFYKPVDMKITSPSHANLTKWRHIDSIQKKNANKKQKRWSKNKKRNRLKQ